MIKLKILSYTSVGALAMALLAPVATLAGNDSNVASHGFSSSVVHRISHSLATNSNYSVNSNVGYKWGRANQRNDQVSAQWASSSPTRSGNKWSNPNVASSQPQSYAGASAYEWGTMGYADESGYKWGLRNFSDQTGYKWGLRNFSDQTGYKWGLRNFFDQTGYKWGLRNFFDQTGYKWGLR